MNSSNQNFSTLRRRLIILGIVTIFGGFVLISPSYTSALTVSSNWNLTSSYPGANGSLSDQSCTAYNGYLYCVGGINGNDLTVQSTYYAQLSSTGGITGSWQQGTDYGPGYISDGSCVAYDGYITCVGGWCTSPDTSLECWQVEGPSPITSYAPISPSGIGSWTDSSAQIPTSIYSGAAGGFEGSGTGLAYNSCIESGGYVYCIGGMAVVTVISGESGVQTEYVPVQPDQQISGINIGTNVISAQLSPTGGIEGGWKYVTAYGGGAAYDLSCITSNGYIYCIGGDIDTSPTTGLSGGASALGTSATNQVWSAQIQSNGGLGSWQEQSSLPQSLDGLSCGITGTTIFCAGGGGSNTYYATFNDGSVGPWFSGPNYPKSVYNPNCVSAGFVYCVGGTTTDDVAYTIGNGITLSDANSCAILGGSWDGSSSTCTVSANVNLNVYLEVTSGTTLDITSSGSLTSTNFLTLDSGGTIINSGTLTSDAPFNLLGTMTSSGTITNDAGDTIQITGTLTNTGTINNQGSLTITDINFQSGLLVNSGSISTTGSGSIVGFEFSINNQCTGTITGNQPPAGAIREIPCTPVITTPSGQVTISSSFTVSGNVNLNGGSPETIFIGYFGGLLATTTTDSSGSWSVSVPLSTGANSLYAQASTGAGFGSILYNSPESNTITITLDQNLDQTTCQAIINGIWDSTTNICYNSGTFTIPSSASFNIGSGTTLENSQTSEIINQGSLTISGTVSNGAGDQLLNFGTLTNTGTITNEGSFVNELGASFTDTGTINTSSGSLTNDGTITITLNSATCQSYPVIGSWVSGYTSTCTIASGASVTIIGGETLYLPTSVWLYNSGTISNSGTIDVSQFAAFYNSCGGTVTGNAVSGSGPVSFSPCAPDITTSSGGVVLGGTLTVAGTANLASNGGATMTITLYSGSDEVGSTTTDSSGDWTIQGSTSPGFLTLYATATSTAGIASPPSNTITLTFQYLDQDSCSSPLGGTWSSNTCAVSGAYTLTGSDSLEVPAGTTLSVSGTFAINGSLSISGAVTNNGVLSGDGTFTVDSGGSLTNNALLTLAKTPGENDGGYLDVSSGGSYTNSAGSTMTNQQDSHIENAGSFTNNGIMTSAFFSEFENDGTFTNAGTITIDSATFGTTSSFTNTGTFNIVFTTDELPEFTAYSGTVYNYGMFNLSGFGSADFQGSGFINEIGATINNEFRFDIAENTINYGTIINTVTQSAITNGGVEFSGNLYVDDTFTNYGSFTNNFHTVISGGTIDNYGLIVNSVLNSGNLTNSGTLTEYCGSSITGAAVLGTAPVTNSQVACPPTILPIQTIATTSDSSTITASGSAQSGVTVNLYLLVSGDLQSEGTVTADSTGSWSVTTASVPLGSYTFVADDTNSYGTSGFSNFVTAEIINLVCSAGSYASAGICVPAPAGYYVPSPGSTSATACPVGTYQPNTGQTSCIQAPLGSFVSTTGATSPTQCSPGTFSDQLGQSSCDDAPPGSYVSSYGAESATLCAEGYFSSSEGQAACTPAPAGSYVSDTGATFATQCPAGTYSSTSGSTSCANAPPGSYVPSPGAPLPTPCAPGTFQPNSAQISCEEAPLGYFVGSSGATSATACSPGTFSSTSGLSACTPAPLGDYVQTSGASSATPCALGTYSDTLGQIACTPAPEGSYVPTTGASSATHCPTGYFSNAVGQSSCTPAPAGYYVSSQGATSPAICAPGTYQPNTAQTSCIEAQPGYYVNSSGETQQTPCPQYYTSNVGASSCYPAPVDVSLTLDPAGGSSSISPTNYFAISYTSDGSAATVQAIGSLTTFTADAGTNVTISATSSGSSTSERWCVTFSGGGCDVTSFATGGGGSISETFTYYQQFLVTFTETGLDGTAGGTIVTIGTTTYSLASLPQSGWVDSGSSVSFNYSPVVASTSVGERFGLTTVSQASPYTVSSPEMITGTYVIQYLLTVTTTPSGLSPSPTNSPTSSSGYYNVRSTVSVTANTVSGYVFMNWQLDTTDETPLVNTVSVIMDAPHTATAVYETPSQSIQSLINTINGMNLPQGTTQFLDAQLNMAITALSHGDTRGAIQILDSIIDELNGPQNGNGRAFVAPLDPSGPGQIPPPDSQLLQSELESIVNTLMSPTSTTVSCTPATPQAGDSIQCTATVTGDQPTGTVTFSSSSSTGAFGSGQVPQASSCQLGQQPPLDQGGDSQQQTSCTVHYTDSSAGTFTITASYGGDFANFASSGTTQVTFAKASTQTSVFCQPEQLQEGQLTTCTTIVTQGNGAPSGTVSWSSNSTTGSFTPSSAICILVANQEDHGLDHANSMTCTIQYSDSAAKPVKITGTYSGDSNSLGSSGSDVVVFSPPEPTTLTLTCNPSTLYTNSQTTCNANVQTSQNSNGPLSGTVSFTSSGSGTFATVQCGPDIGNHGLGNGNFAKVLDSGGHDDSLFCSAGYTSSASGTQTITATYSGDPYNSPISNQSALTVNPQTTTATTVTCTQSDQPQHDPQQDSFIYTCTATVTGITQVHGEQGTVTFTSTSSTGSFQPQNGACQLGQSGACSIQYSDTSAGSVTITATFGGDVSGASSSGSTTFTIAQSTTTTSLDCDQTQHSGGSWTCTATVSGANPTGTVSFTASGGSLSSDSCKLQDGPGPLGYGCSVTFTDTAETGSVTITSTYSGDSNNAGSSDTAAIDLGQSH